MIVSKARLFLLGALAVFAASAVAAASASAQNPAPHYFYCGQPGGSTWLYENNLCTKDKKGAGTWELRELPLATLLLITSEGGPYKLETEILLTKSIIECAKESGHGWIENPAGGGPGIDLVTNSFTSCSVKKPKNCTVTEPIVARSNSKLVELTDGSFWDLFGPDPEGSAFTSITLNGASCALPGTFEIKGQTYGKVNNATGKISFSASMDELTFAGEPAILEGESLVLTDGGGTVQVLLSTN
jgi:hypothetical protein